MKRSLAGILACSMVALVGAGCVTEVGSDEGSEEDLSIGTDNESADVILEGKALYPIKSALLQPNLPTSGFVDGDARGLGVQNKAPKQQPTGDVTGYGITYHNGPVMTSAIKLYFIWYGNWSGNSATTILTDLANSIGGSSHWNINTTYKNGSNTPVSNSVTYGGSTNDNYSKGTNLSDNAIKSVVSTAITSGKLPKDANGIYFVLTSADVNATSGFCSQYCGWHTYASISNANIKYSFVGNADRCPDSCAWQTSSPNGNAGADAMASIIMHEAEEAATDPQLNAWYDSSGYENADKCAWTFGNTWISGGGEANIHLGSRDYLIQQNWVNASGAGCKMSYP